MPATHFSFSRSNSKILTYHTPFLPLTVAKLPTFKNSPVYLAHPTSAYTG